MNLNYEKIDKKDKIEMVVTERCHIKGYSPVETWCVDALLFHKKKKLNKMINNYIINIVNVCEPRV